MDDKKILAEEIMSDEELDDVAGGSISQLISDVKDLKSMGFDISTVGDGSVASYCNNASYYKEKVKEAFASAGIDAKIFMTTELDNQYLYEGREVSREKALAWVKRFGDHKRNIHDINNWR